MKTLKYVSLLIFFLFLVVSNGMALFSFSGYSLLSNTTSHLGAKGSPNSWVMNSVFVALGTMAILVTFHTGVRYHQIVGAIFGLSLVMTGFFQHAPLIQSMSVNQLEDQIHSIFAGITGFSFTILAVDHTFISSGSQRTAGIIMAIVAIVISLAMMNFPAIMGLLQRVMFVSAFGWLFFFLKTPNGTQVFKNPNFDRIS
ncbi:DUF998 domain-containing protein [Metaplanococcus flavidus]|uniref:DUF998 domain-containing protein n=1 Tax=Metaplanococcus flavidus TaxID=569883 RepID=A0ABW3LBT5_9BACL